LIIIVGVTLFIVIALCLRKRKHPGQNNPSIIDSTYIKKIHDIEAPLESNGGHDSVENVAPWPCEVEETVTKG